MPKRTKSDILKTQLVEALEKTLGVVTSACKVVGVARSTFYEWYNDDLEFKKFKETLNGEDNVVLLNPSKVKSGYYVETGWATTNKNIDVPNAKSKQKISYTRS